jgi:ER-bound oxygenase mpaB/B'/Rubber oxygenase, catalytic domain
MSVSEWTDLFLDSLRAIGDPPADKVIADLFAGTADASRAFRALVVQHNEVADPAMAAFINDMEAPPSWLDPLLVAEGQECFARWGSHVFTALYAAALPSAYASWRGVQVLGLTARLETDAKRRLNETAQFHLDVMERGGLDPGKGGHTDVRHVRLMHAAVRWLIENDPRAEWDPAWGTPINQEDLLETLLTFTEIVFEVFDRTGVHYTSADAHAYLHTWSYIGWLLGIRPDLLPLTRAQTSTLMPMVRRRQFGHSEAGQMLTAALLDQGTRLVPPGLRGLPASTLRFYIGDETADFLGVPPSDWTRYVFGPMATLSRRMSLGWLHNHVLRTLSDRIGFGMLSLAVSAERFGARPQFAVPTSLAERWNLPATVHRAPLTDHEIAAMTDPVLRNLWITQRYHELAVQLREAGAEEDATWCAFAVWASKTAGATIRGEVLPARAQRILVENEGVKAALHELGHGAMGHVWTALARRDPIGRAFAQVTADVAAAIAEGNVMVFAELAPVFDALLVARRGATPPDPAALMRAVDPLLAPLQSSGIDTAPLQQAFAAYAQSLGTEEDRAALVLEANILAVAHEQQRLQPAIARALDAAVSDTLQRLIENDILRHVPGAEAKEFLAHLFKELCTLLDEAWDVVLTEAIMQLVTAAETFDLRRDVPPVAGVLFPPALHDLTGTPAAQVLATWDRTQGTGRKSGAEDWAVLEDRMNFIVNLFRSRQQNPHLFDPPFTDEQLAVMGRGQVPPGPL